MTAFLDWLKSGRKRVGLAHLGFKYQSAGAPASGTLRFCDHPPGSVGKPWSTPYRANIRQLPTFNVAIPTSPVDARTKVSLGELVFDNADGSLDFMLSLAMDGEPATFYWGDPSWLFEDFEPFMVAVVDSVSASAGMTITVRLKDARLLLDKEISGGLTNYDERAPLVFGTAYNLSPVLTAEANLTYAFHNDGTATLLDLRDDGVSLNSGVIIAATNATLTADGTGLLQYVGHDIDVDDVLVLSTTGDFFFGMPFPMPQLWVVATDHTANAFRFSLTKGGTPYSFAGTTFSGTISITRRRYYLNESLGVATGEFQLSAKAIGALTCDVGAGIGGFPAQGNEFLYRLMEIYGGLVAGVDLDEASLTGALDRLAGRAVVQAERLVEVLDDIARAYMIAWGPDELGVIRGAQLDLAGLPSAEPDHEITRDSVDGEIDVVIEPAMVASVGVMSRRNVRVQNYGEFGDDVDPSDRTKWSIPYQLTTESTVPTGTAYATNFPLYHQLATHVDVQSATIEDGADLQALADDMLADLRPPRWFITARLGLEAYNWRHGEVVRVTYSRYDLDDGVNFRIVSRQVDPTAGVVTLQLLARRDPDVTTASYA